MNGMPPSVFTQYMCATRRKVSWTVAKMKIRMTAWFVNQTVGHMLQVPN